MHTRIQFILGVILVAGLFSCKTKTTVTERCGDGFLDPGEDCDGNNLNNYNCANLGHYNIMGTLRCGSDCQFDRTECGGRCGDGQITIDDGEVCDGINLLGASCTGLGYHGGTLACATDCKSLDTSDCEPFGKCGDGIIQTEHGEVCDGELLNNQTCETRGYYGGTLTCSANCRGFVETDCVDFGRCGDGILHTEHGEECDGVNLAEQDCESLGLYPGTLTCGTNCRFDTSGCGGSCGDGIIQTGQGEQCDTDNFGSQTCSSLGYYTGPLICTDDCTISESNCEGTGSCGDGIIQTPYETCDGENLDGQTCISLNYHPGTLACASNCAFDTTSCGGKCGDGIIQTDWEECDLSGFGGATCRTRGFFLGNLLCQMNCTINDSLCTKVLSVAAGADHTCALTEDKNVYCWGYNQYGQLGDGTTTDRLNPVKVNISNIDHISAGDGFTCATSQHGAYCWGRNEFGQLGNGTNTNSSDPVQVQLSGFMVLFGTYPIFAGKDHACTVDVLNMSLFVKCWGRNDFGQLGNGTNTNRSTPEPGSNLDISAPGSVLMFALGDGHTCATGTINGNNRLYCWGRNDSGQLGIGNTQNQLTPADTNVATNDLTSVSAVLNSTIDGRI